MIRGPGDAVDTFLNAFVLALGALLISGSPLFVVALSKGRRLALRQVSIAAGVIGTLVAGMALASVKLEQQCRAAGNPSCIDFGLEGFLLIVAVGWIITTWTAAVVIHRQ